MTARVRALHTLAKAYGVQRQWKSFDGRRVTTNDDTLVELLRGLGAPLDDTAGAPDALRAVQAARSATVVPPVVVQPSDTAFTIDVRLPTETATLDAFAVTLEDGTTIESSPPQAAFDEEAPAEPHVLRLRMPEPLGAGVHRLHVEVGGVPGDATVLAAPARARAGDRRFGVFAPLYALHDDERRATGDLATFERFSRWASSCGATVIGTLPLLATFFGAGREPSDPSPYAPVSRRHWNEVYLDLAAVPEVDGAAVAEPSPGEYVDLVALAARKRIVLEAALGRLERLPARRTAFAAFLEARPDVVAYARFRAATELGVAGGRDPAVGIEHPVARYHAYAQWLIEAQLDECNRRLARRDQELYLDLPIGAHPLGFDVASEAALFAHDASVGAPPDQFFRAGQNWGFPPVLPEAARERLPLPPRMLRRAFPCRAPLARRSHPRVPSSVVGAERARGRRRRVRALPGR